MVLTTGKATERNFYLFFKTTERLHVHLVFFFSRHVILVISVIKGLSLKCGQIVS